MSDKVEFYGIAGSNANSKTISTEIPIATLLKIVEVCNFDAVDGLDEEKQKGINRPLDNKRAIEIAKVFDEQIAKNYPMENGSVSLAAIEENLAVEPVEIAGNIGLVRVTVNKPIPAIDRQHTTEAFRVALANQDSYPHLFEYINNPANTISIRIVECSRQDARRRCIATNSGQKKWTALETFTALILDAKLNEAAGIRSHVKERPALVVYQYAYNMAKDPTHPLYNLINVDSGMADGPKKMRTNCSNFIDASLSLYEIAEEQKPQFELMSIEQQADYLKEITLPFWTKLKALLPNCFGPNWYNYNLFRKAAPIMAECFNGFLRLWLDYRDKKSIIPVLNSIHGTTLEEFVSNNIVEIIDSSDASYPWKREEYWAIPGGAFINNYRDWKVDETCKYIWGTLRPEGVGKETWALEIRAIRHIASKLRYNQHETTKRKRKKGPIAASEARKRRKGKNKKIRVTYS